MAYEFIGDVNLEHGGIYINLSDWKEGYACAVEICDLDGACGFTGAVFIRNLTLIKPRNETELNSVLSVVGHETEKVSDLDVAYAAFSYGLYDGEPEETIQLEDDGEVRFDGWSADFKAPTGFDLRNYVEKNYLEENAREEVDGI